MSGDVVVLDFPFSDFQHAKRRPALVLHVFRTDVFIAQITSRAYRDEYSVPLDSQDFLEGGLQLSSLIRADFLITCAQSLVLYKVGRVHDKKLCEVINVTCAMLRGEA
ncbi:TPA: type II toxin-antitoxin system PemK/MazF family toxin [Candidatus Woesearchaeota archaeon]|nr:type II toxin-antitoxin system PemK/MazF family toxin [Candidatus Woesearchaeota archaeon]